jgi:sortase A
MPRLRVRYLYQERSITLWVRWICLVSSAACLLTVAFAWVHRYRSQAEARITFEQLISESTVPVPPPQKIEKPAVRNQGPSKQPIAKLEINRLGISGFVEEGLDAPTLARAIGHSPSSAKPGDSGNIVLAAHRDTFFSGLKDVKLDDTIEMQSPSGATHIYKVSQILIVDAKDSQALQSLADQDMLTLVTCYPFHFIGSAPQRLIVQAQPIAPPEIARKFPRPRA